MRTSTKIWLIVAACFVLLGGILFASAMSVHRWDSTQLSTVKYETNVFDIREEFKNISIQTDTADILFALSQDGICHVECYEEETAKHSATVTGDTLVIQMHNKKSWYDYIGIHFGTPKITVYLPKEEYASLTVTGATGDLEIPKDFGFETVDVFLSTGDVKCFASTSDLAKIKTSTGDIKVEKMSAGMLDLSVSTGDVIVGGVVCNGDLKIHVSTGETKVTDTTCQTLISDGTTGDITLKNTIATGNFSIDRSTGDVKLEDSDAAELYLNTSTGDIKGSLLTDKVFIADSSSGHMDVPKSTAGGRCEATTNTGDIVLAVKN